MVNGREVQVPVPVVRRIEETFAEGPPIHRRLRRRWSSAVDERAGDCIPCGDGGGGNVSDSPEIEIVPFEVASPVAGMPSIPGVILIEGASRP